TDSLREPRIYTFAGPRGLQCRDRHIFGVDKGNVFEADAVHSLVGYDLGPSSDPVFTWPDEQPVFRVFHLRDRRGSLSMASAGNDDDDCHIDHDPLARKLPGKLGPPIVWTCRGGRTESAYRAGGVSHRGRRAAGVFVRQGKTTPD